MKAIALMMGYSVIIGVVINLQIILNKKWSVGFDLDLEQREVIFTAMLWPISLIPCICVLALLFLQDKMGEE